MEATTIAPTTTTATPVANAPKGGIALTGEDFFKLLIAQLSNQDPLEPTSNQELLQQLSSIRDIELSTTLTESLKSLTAQQRYASAAGLIGHYVTGRSEGDDPARLRPEGVVTGVQFTADGAALLQLDNGLEFPLERLETVVAKQAGTTMLVGRMVTGVDRSDPEALRVIEGIVTGIRKEADGSVMLELDTGETLPLKDMLSAAEVT
ncbi:MAG: hypothetical protein IID40_07435 [Planctomycetes bacterium]|nr:hypothetical protein [Planctomycetota bacterium]